MAHGNDHEHSHDQDTGHDRVDRTTHSHPRPHDHAHGPDHVQAHSRTHEHPVRLHAVVNTIKHAHQALGWPRTLAALAALYLLSGLFFVFADQQAVVLVFGKVREPRVQPGIHWTWPYPLARIEKHKVWETKRLTVGIEAPDQILGRGAGEVRAQFLTGDQNIISIRLAVQYAVKDPVDYLFKTKDVTAVIAKSVEAMLSDVVVQRKVDDLLTTEKVVVQQQIRQKAQDLLDGYQSGVYLSSVSIESIAPPDEVQEAFRDVASAREDRERIQREADSYANDVVPRARGESARLMEEATGYYQRKINEAQGDAARFTSLAAEYARARDVTGARLFLETMEEVLPRLKKIVVEGNIDVDMIQKK